MKSNMNFISVNFRISNRIQMKQIRIRMKRIRVRMKRIRIRIGFEYWKVKIVHHYYKLFIEIQISLFFVLKSDDLLARTLRIYDAIILCLQP